MALPLPDLNALFLMRHMAVHFAAVEIGLRHLSDWAVFLAADGRRVNWQELRAVYREHNMLRFADAVTGLCVRYLGVDPDVCPTRRIRSCNAWCCGKSCRPPLRSVTPRAAC